MSSKPANDLGIYLRDRRTRMVPVALGFSAGRRRTIFAIAIGHHVQGSVGRRADVGRLANVGRGERDRRLSHSTSASGAMR